jgi:hypothetical protein
MGDFTQKALTDGTADPAKPASVFISNKTENLVTVDLVVPTQEEKKWLDQMGVALPQVSSSSADPRSHSDFVDNILLVVTYYILTDLKAQFLYLNLISILQQLA